MDVKHLDAQSGCLDGRFGDRVGNVVKFQVEKNLAAEMLNQTHRLRPGMGKELLADLEHADFAGKQADQFFRLFEIVDVEGNDQSLAHGPVSTNQLELGSHVLRLQRLVDDRANFCCAVGDRHLFGLAVAAQAQLKTTLFQTFGADGDAQGNADQDRRP